MKMSFNFAALQGTKQQQQYDNLGAHAEVETMMKRGDKLSNPRRSQASNTNLMSRERTTSLTT